MRSSSQSAFALPLLPDRKTQTGPVQSRHPGQNIPYSFVPLLLDINLRELPFNGCCDGGVFRFSAGAGQGIASVNGIFYRVPPGFRKYKITLRQVFALCVRQFRHPSTSGLPSPVTGIFCQRDSAGLSKIALRSKVGHPLQ
jgi:hypothetical protein